MIADKGLPDAAFSDLAPLDILLIPKVILG